MSIRSVDWATLRWLRRYLVPHRLPLLTVAMLSLVQSGLTLPTLALVRDVLDEVLPAGDAARLPWIAAAIIGLRVAGTLLALVVRTQVLQIAKTVVLELRQQIAQHLVTRSYQYFASADLTQLHTRIVQDSERLDVSLTTIVAGVLPSLFSVLLLLSVMAWISPALVLIGLLTMPALWLVGRFTTRRVQRDLFAFRDGFEAVSAGTHFLLRFSELVRIRGMADHELREQSARQRRLRDLGVQMGRSFSVHVNVQRIVTGLLGISLLVAGGFLVIRHEISLGAFLVFYVAATMLSSHLESLGGAVSELVSGAAAAAALRQVLSDGGAEPYSGTRPVELRGGLALRAVEFGYDRKPPLFTNLSLEFAPGDHVLVMGENGAGKSTLAQLLLGTLRPSAGAVFVDGVPYDEVHLPSLRRQIALVPQHPHYFRGTVRQNLEYGLEDVVPEALTRALEQSRFADVVARLPDGLDTVIGDRGTTLSGGEAQRLSLARMLLQAPRFVILDEPTTHLDAESVQHLVQQLRDWRDGPTLLIISHDPAVLSFTTRAFRLTNGELVSESNTIAASR